MKGEVEGTNIATQPLPLLAEVVHELVPRCLNIFQSFII